MLRERQEPQSNYSALYLNGKTIRIPIKAEKPITELQYPEFYDVAINSLCYGGCSYCYTCATSKGRNFTNILNKIQHFFGNQSLNERPFQVALGGSGEPTLHTHFVEVLQLFQKLHITPNYTTNGMHLSKPVLEATKEYCGGVALTIHPHLKPVWEKAIGKLHKAQIITNLHIIISDKASIDEAARLYEVYKDQIEYFVLLPLMHVGFAKESSKQIDYTHLQNWLDTIHKEGKIAFGANFYDFLLKHPEYDLSLYPPEILSKYLVLDDPIKIYKNSFEPNY